MNTDKLNPFVEVSTGRSMKASNSDIEYEVFHKRIVCKPTALGLDDVAYIPHRIGRGLVIGKITVVNSSFYQDSPGPPSAGTPVMADATDVFKFEVEREFVKLTGRAGTPTSGQETLDFVLEYCKKPSQNLAPELRERLDPRNMILADTNFDLIETFLTISNSRGLNMKNVIYAVIDRAQLFSDSVAGIAGSLKGKDLIIPDNEPIRLIDADDINSLDASGGGEMVILIKDESGLSTGFRVFNLNTNWFNQDTLEPIAVMNDTKGPLETDSEIVNPVSVLPRIMMRLFGTGPALTPSDMYVMVPTFAGTRIKFFNHIGRCVGNVRVVHCNASDIAGDLTVGLVKSGASTAPYLNDEPSQGTPFTGNSGTKDTVIVAIMDKELGQSPTTGGTQYHVFAKTLIQANAIRGVKVSTGLVSNFAALHPNLAAAVIS